MWIPGQSGRDGDCPPGSRGEDIGGRMRGMRQQEVRASEGQYSELMQRRDWEQQEALLSHYLGLLRAADTRLSFRLLKHQDNFSSSHRGHPLIEIMQSLQISLKMWN